MKNDSHGSHLGSSNYSSYECATAGTGSDGWRGEGEADIDSNPSERACGRLASDRSLRYVLHTINAHKIPQFPLAIEVGYTSQEQKLKLDGPNKIEYQM